MHPARLTGSSLLRTQSDERLVALAREGHDPAFAAIVDRYRGPLERYCGRLLGDGRGRIAEDAVQQAFVNAHTALRASDRGLALKPWLYRIAHNAALNIVRSSQDGETLDEDRAGPSQTADLVELRERLRETLSDIQALPAVQRDALLLREVEGRTHEEIAVALGVTPGGARQHLHRARIALRAAASAITPYPVLARLLTMTESARGTDLVTGAALGTGAGAVKAAAGVLAAGALVGGALTATHRAIPSPSVAAAGVDHPASVGSSGATAPHSPGSVRTPGRSGGSPAPHVRGHRSGAAGSHRPHGPASEARRGSHALLPAQHGLVLGDSPNQGDRGSGSGSGDHGSDDSADGGAPQHHDGSSGHDSSSGSGHSPSADSAHGSDSGSGVSGADDGAHSGAPDGSGSDNSGPAGGSASPDSGHGGTTPPAGGSDAPAGQGDSGSGHGGGSDDSVPDRSGTSTGNGPDR